MKQHLRRQHSGGWILEELTFVDWRWQIIVGAVLMSISLSVSMAAAQPASDAPATSDEDGVAFFEKKIRPLLIQRCFECHSEEAKSVHGGLRLDSPDALEQGGDSGPVVDVAKPHQSLLLTVLSHTDDIQMPPRGKLPDSEISLLTEWVRRGTPFPDNSDAITARTGAIDFEAGRKHWAFQPLAHCSPPSVEQESWPRQPIDYFLLAAMERNGIAPSSEADRATLLRRVYFDVVGLPPSPAELQAFLNDDGADAYENVVDRLLALPQFGERWARFWLDLARYTDKTASWLDSTGKAHLYRDWVVRAFNDDMPYDQFIKRQLATDMMPQTGAEDVAALGFVGLSPNYWKELKLPSEIIKVIVADEWEERVDAVSRTFLGLTVACARCHDHKFDPVSTEDYYAMAGIFASCRIGELPTISSQLYAPVQAAKKEVAELEKQLAALKKQTPPPADQMKSISQKISQIRSATPNYDAPVATGLLEQSLYVVRAGERADQGTRLDYRPEPRNLNLFIRGNPNRLGDIVPRRFLTVLSNERSQPYTKGSGRLELAESITHEAATLAARVVVNRVWGMYFGKGIVTTPSNFGVLGDHPSHPELLDDLAARFIDCGWSLKSVHREILLSSAYRQTCRTDARRAEVDPDNTLLWRMARRRLDFEQWRDAMLSATGQLELTMGGPAIDLDAAENHRRSLYVTVHRREMSNVMLNHDFPAPTAHSPKRANTTTALQGLYALNGPLVNSQARVLAERLLKDVSTDEARIEMAYQLLFSRMPTAREKQLGVEFLHHQPEENSFETWQQFCHVLLASNEFAYLD